MTVFFIQVIKNPKSLIENFFWKLIYFQYNPLSNMKRSSRFHGKESKSFYLILSNILNGAAKSKNFQSACVKTSCNTRTYLMFYAKKLHSLSFGWHALYYLRLIIKIICRGRIYYKWHNNHKNKTDSHTRAMVYVGYDLFISSSWSAQCNIHRFTIHHITNTHCYI